jgi:hypothetical protein
VSATARRSYRYKPTISPETRRRYASRLAPGRRAAGDDHPLAEQWKLAAVSMRSLMLDAIALCSRSLSKARAVAWLQSICWIQLALGACDRCTCSDRPLRPLLQSKIAFWLVTLWRFLDPRLKRHDSVISGREVRVEPSAKWRCRSRGSGRSSRFETNSPICEGITAGGRLTLCPVEQYPVDPS